MKKSRFTETQIVSILKPSDTAERGVSPAMLTVLLGHTDPRMTQHYLDRHEVR